MKLFDISRELLSAPVYPGDPQPRLEYLSRTEMGDFFTLSTIYCCNHAATHIDAPAHFLEGGADIASIDPSVFCGECRVVSIDAPIITGADIEALHLGGAFSRLLIRGRGGRLNRSAASELVAEGVRLVGIDSPTLGAEKDDMLLHRELAAAGVCILEGLELDDIYPARYTLMAFPLKIAGAEAAPCRAVLMQDDV